MTKKTFISLEKTTSTNIFMLEMPEHERVDAVVCACEQSGGKGMGTNVWESAPGQNLTFSMGADMSFLKAADQFLLSQAVPLGLLDVLDTMLSVKAFVKWPNDIIVDGRKLCGILINSTIHGEDMGVSVIGIGLNVNQMRFQDWPTHPVSLKMLLGREVALEPLLHQLVDAVEHRIEMLWSPDGIAQIKDDYLCRLFRYHQWGNYETKESVVKLYVDGIDEFGRLMTLDESGKAQIFDVKELRLV